MSTEGRAGLRKGQWKPPERLSIALGCSKLELGERYPSPPQTKSPLFLPNLLPARRAAESTSARWERAAQGRGADRRLSGGQQTHAVGSGRHPGLGRSRNGSQGGRGDGKQGAGCPQSLTVDREL